MTRTSSSLVPAIVLGATFGVAAALVVEVNAAAPVLSDDAKRAAEKPGAIPRFTDRADLLKARASEAGVSTYTCPPVLEIGGSNTTFARGSLALTGARVSDGRCGAGDLAPTAGRGGHCMTCSYENGVSLQRSGGPNKVCWRVPDTGNQMACEAVPPVPPSQTCRFEIDPPTIDLMPLRDHLGGDDELYAGGGIGSNSSIVNIRATLDRGTGSDKNKLFLDVSTTIKESAPDYTLFRDTKRVEIKTSHLADGTAADIAACLGNFTANRPFEPVTGSNGMLSWEYEPQRLRPIHGQGDLKIAATCIFDSPGGDVGDVGCDPIDIEPFTITLR